jgi:hypothetical protein
MIWERNGDAYYAIAETTLGKNRYYLVVERLSDWSVRRPGGSPEMAMHGLAHTVHFVMRAAESVVR